MTDEKERELLERISYLEKQVAALTGVGTYTWFCPGDLSSSSIMPSKKDDFSRFFNAMSARVDETLTAREEFQKKYGGAE